MNKPVAFNPSVESLKETLNSDHVIHIHVGKAAGTSIQDSLSRHLSDTPFSISEYHCFDSNTRIADLLYNIPEENKISLVIPIRDPLERFISALHWDIKRYTEDPTTFAEAHEISKALNLDTNPLNLIDELIKGNLLANKLSQVGHMKMGYSWYMPTEIHHKLSKFKLYAIEVDHIEEHTLAAINAIRSTMGIPQCDSFVMPHKKKAGSHSPGSPGPTQLAISQMDSSTLLLIRESFLSHEYKAIDSLRTRAHRY